MKVFVTGGTGAIGRYAVPALVAAGHEVHALVRTDEKAAQLRAQGSVPVPGVSLFEASQLKDAFSGIDAVANLATAIPPVTKALRAGAWAENERIRREGSAAVVDAALAAGVGRLVQESITFTYPSSGAEWIDESVPVEVPEAFDAVVVAETNAARFTAQGGIGVVLRFGLLREREQPHRPVRVRGQAPRGASCRSARRVPVVDPSRRRTVPALAAAWCRSRRRNKASAASTSPTPVQAPGPSESSPPPAGSLPWRTAPGRGIRAVPNRPAIGRPLD